MFDNTTKLVLLFVISVIACVGVGLIYHRYNKPIIVVESEIQPKIEEEPKKPEVAPVPPDEHKIDPKIEEEDTPSPEHGKRKRLRDRRK